MALRRGFKAEANRWARDLRSELGLQPESPLCPWRMCGHLEIPVIELRFFQAFEPDHVAYLYSEIGREEFSAVTFLLEDRRHIVHNDAHHRKRQASNLSHEIAHALLMHPVLRMIGEDGRRTYVKELEEEANWLGPALLISDEAAVFIAESKMSVTEASDYFGATRDVVQMRLNVSGVRKRVA